MSWRLSRRAWVDNPFSPGRPAVLGSGVPGDKFRPDGWLNRALQARADRTGDWPAPALTPELPRICYGAQPVAVLRDLDTLRAPLAQAAVTLKPLSMVPEDRRRTPLNFRRPSG